MGGPFRGNRSWPPVPRLWPGETVVIAASGPSLAGRDLERCRGHARLIVVNTTFRLAPWADLLYACDAAWWDAHPEAMDFAGLKVTQDARVKGVNRVPSVNEPGLSLDPMVIHQGANGGYQALNLALLLGAARVVLLGFDMGETGGRKHWHGAHGKGLNNPGLHNFNQWIAAFETTPPDLERAGVAVANCSRATALTCFERADLESIL